MDKAFQFARTPHLHFGVGKIKLLPSLLKAHGRKVLLIKGKRSFDTSEWGNPIVSQLHSASFEIEAYSIDGEPTPAIVDQAVLMYADWKPEVVVAVGGGSVLDAGKAISAMLMIGGSVKDYLEGVGTRSHSGVKIPFVAVPTTAGTGSEATKNAVLAETGPGGFKKSLRHDNFVPDVAIVDPALSVGCPPAVTAASGMDAFTQLLESYLSTAANAITDALAIEGLRRAARSLIAAYRDGSNVAARTDMAMAAYLSGITLANAGLGAVHGLAGTIGGMYTISHGVICSSLMASANEVTLRKLREKEDQSVALAKYAEAGMLLSNTTGKTPGFYADLLIDRIREWAEVMQIPSLSTCGLPAESLKSIAAASDSKNNPVALDMAELEEVMLMSM